MERRNFEVPKAHSGEAVARILHDGLEVPHTVAKGLIDEGCVRLNGRPVKTHGQRCAGGDVVEVVFDPARQYRPRPEPRPGSGFRVLYEDREIVVVDKDPGILTSPAPGDSEESVAERIAASLKKRGFKRAQLFVVHRLDRHTSGLLVLARTSRALESLTAQFESRQAGREYVAFVNGIVEKDRGTIQSWLTEDPRSLSVRTTPLRGAGKRAITHFEVAERFPASTLVRVRLETGRKHQIRIHFAEIGHPVIGDRRYGSTSSLLTRVALHAERLSFKHPQTLEAVSFEATWPADLMKLKKSLATFHGEDLGMPGAPEPSRKQPVGWMPRVSVFPKGLVLTDNVEPRTVVRSRAPGTLKPSYAGDSFKRDRLLRQRSVGANRPAWVKPPGRDDRGEAPRTDDPHPDERKFGRAGERGGPRGPRPEDARAAAPKREWDRAGARGSNVPGGGRDAGPPKREWSRTAPREGGRDAGPPKREFSRTAPRDGGAPPKREWSRTAPREGGRDAGPPKREFSRTAPRDGGAPPKREWNRTGAASGAAPKRDWDRSGARSSNVPGGGRDAGPPKREWSRTAPREGGRDAGPPKREWSRTAPREGGRDAGPPKRESRTAPRDGGAPPKREWNRTGATAAAAPRREWDRSGARSSNVPGGGRDAGPPKREWKRAAPREGGRDAGPPKREWNRTAPRDGGAPPKREWNRTATREGAAPKHPWNKPPAKNSAPASGGGGKHERGSKPPASDRPAREPWEFRQKGATFRRAKRLKIKAARSKAKPR